MAHDPLSVEGDPLLFRRALGNFATGVAVVTATVAGTAYGMAVNSFTSVSLDPPLIGFCAARSSTTWPRIRTAELFAASILAAEHEHISRTFGLPGRSQTGPPRPSPL